MGDIRDKTTKWLWSIAPSHMKEGNKIDEERDSYKLFSIWAKNTEEFKKKAYDVRKERFPQYASSDSLRMIGEERGILPIEEETIEDYRIRVINALDFWEKAGSVRGIKEVLKKIGFEEIEIQRVGRERWAEFTVGIRTKNRQMTKEFIEFLVALINKLKPAHEKLSKIVFLPHKAELRLYTGLVIHHGYKIHIPFYTPQFKVSPCNSYVAIAMHIAMKTEVRIDA